jgi:hypothetical protein
MEGLAEIITDFFNSIGHGRTSPVRLAMSALPPKADMRDPTSIRLLCAKSGQMRRSKPRRYSMISCA